MQFHRTPDRAIVKPTHIAGGSPTIFSRIFPLRSVGARKSFFLCFIVFGFLIGAAFPAFSHRVHIFAYVEGDTIYTESYFTDGTPVNDGKIEVFDSSQKSVFTGQTDHEGLLRFTIPKTDNLTIVLEATMGHRATFEIPVEELEQFQQDKSAKEAVQEKSQAVRKKEITEELGKERDYPSERQFLPEEKTEIRIEDVRRVVQEEVSRELEPISKRIARLERKAGPSVTEIFGGIGYIIGIMGLIMYFKSKAKK